MIHISLLSDFTQILIDIRHRRIKSETDSVGAVNCEKLQNNAIRNLPKQTRLTE